MVWPFRAWHDPWHLCRPLAEERGIIYYHIVVYTAMVHYDNITIDR